jgi:hypothetical protein
MRLSRCRTRGLDPQMARFGSLSCRGSTAGVPRRIAGAGGTLDGGANDREPSSGPRIGELIAVAGVDISNTWWAAQLAYQRPD